MKKDNKIEIENYFVNKLSLRYLEENEKIADEACLASLSAYIQQAANALCVGGSSK